MSRNGGENNKNQKRHCDWCKTETIHESAPGSKWIVGYSYKVYRRERKCRKCSVTCSTFEVSSNQFFSFNNLRLQLKVANADREKFCAAAKERRQHDEQWLAAIGKYLA